MMARLQLLLARLLAGITKLSRGLGKGLGPVLRGLGRVFKGLWQGLKWLGRGLRRLWGWCRARIRDLRNRYESWMLNSLLLVGAGALIYGLWVLKWYPEPLDPRLTILPGTLIALMIFCLGLIGYSFWKPKAQNPLTTPIELQRLYQPWMLSLVSLLAIGGMIYGFWKLNASNPAAIQPKTKGDDSISLRFEGVELRGRKQGTPFFTIQAEKVVVSKNNDEVTFLKGKTKPHGEFYNLKDWEEDASGALPKRRAVTWEADKAVFNTVDQNLSMLGGVKIKTDAGDTILTEEMLWNRNEQTLVSHTRTKVHTHQDTYLESNRLKVETNTKALTLEGQVSIDMKLNQEKVIDVDKFEH